MSEFKIQRLSYTWKGEWTPGEEYQRDDVVSLNGKSYVCLEGHTADSNFLNDLNAVLPNSDPPQIVPRWVLMTNARSFRGNWETGTEYNLSELVYYKGSIFLCIAAHIAGIFSQDRDNWTIFAQHIAYLGDWTSGDDYADGSLVRYNGVVYKCITAHTAGALLEDDEDKWQVFFEGREFRGEWSASTEFRVNDLVKFGASIFRCIESHTSQSQFNTEKFALEFAGFQFEGDWNSQTNYQQGDIVKYGGILYTALESNIRSQPFIEIGQNPQWERFSDSRNFLGEYDLDVEYKTGDVVQRGGFLYVARQDILRNNGDGSTLDYLEPDWWEVLIPGSVWAQQWTNGAYYKLGDVVYFRGTAYSCNFEHIADELNFPGDNGNIEDYWDTLIQSGQPGGLEEKGDLLTYGLFRSVVGDISSLGDTRVAIGNEEDVLSVTDELEVFWREREFNSDVIYVAEDGIDDETIDKNRGLVKDKPFRTIKHAAQYIEDNFEPLSLTSIKVATGRYEEIAPIIVPAGCAILGDELRSTTIVASPPIAAYQNDFQYLSAYITHLTTFILDVLQNTPIEPTPGNNVSQILDATPTNLDGVNAVLDLAEQYLNYIEFRVAGGSIDPELLGSNTPNGDQNIINAGISAFENRAFHAAELTAYLRQEFPEQTFDDTRIKNDVYSLLRGIKRDLAFSGNYATLLAAERYVNAALGPQDQNLFHVRDTTGIRQCSFRGLEGDITPITEDRQYQVATGGAYVALDPGWGPDDERTWIKNRSPYIQGVTTIGTGCVGKRVDGSLHNGGNKSMVSNDFTQVLSDGVGVWVSDGGRTELVSVFSYYCSVGYLAEQGGVIRATNGNNSYGRYGTVADGNDPQEVPQFAEVFNRNNEAQVLDAFAGRLTDEILAFEYGNAGENYSQATANVIGAGDLVATEFTDFRDGAVFEERIINTSGSGNPGGSQYLVRQGFAQVTFDASTSILLSATDSTTIDTDYIGARIIIINGQGAGQYAYIVSYNIATKEAIVRRESDDQLGWDHIIPGTPIEPTLNSTAQYRIEPRLEVTAPGFSNTTANFMNGRTVIDSVYGETTAVFENIELPPGSITDPDFPTENAIVTVTRKATEYTIDFENTGAGYVVGDSFTITADNLDGVSPTNDLEITVTEVTDDSTASIVSASTRGVGRSGRLIAIAEPNFVLYSDNGTDWQENNLSFVSAYKTVIAGDAKFIAVAEAENRISYSLNGIDWEDRELPATENWQDAAYGNGTFVIIADNTNNVLYSADAETWNESDIPDDTVSDSTGDSTIPSYTHITYGKGQFLAVSSSDRATATSTDGVTWTRHNESLIDRGDAFVYDITGLAWGDNKYLLLTRDGQLIYSFNGIDWLEGATAPLPSGDIEYISFKYFQGVFLALARNTNTGVIGFVATTEDGQQWQQQTLTTTQNFTAFGFGTVNTLPEWFLFADSVSQDAITIIRTGKRAKLRSSIDQGSFDAIKIWDPGSGYAAGSDLEITITDSQFTVEVETETRLGNGVLSQPDFINRGSGYVANSSSVEIIGNGFADIIPEDDELTIRGVTNIPSVGVQIRIESVQDEENPAQLKLFSGVRVQDLGDDGTGNGTRLIRFQVSPTLENEFNISNGSDITLRERYSQARVTNHDYLDIGTGNFEETNYPNIYANANFFEASPEQEVVQFNGGRVFYVSTDQDGNFRGGDLFAVEQATGTVTISAEFFDLEGLSELALGGIRLGGSGTVVREFSTDANFSQDSDNVIPTQRAISRFIANRLSVGGENIETNQLQAGRVIVGSSENVLDTISSEYLIIDADIIHEGTDENGNLSGVSGTIISQQLFLRNANDSVQ